MSATGNGAAPGSALDGLKVVEFARYISGPYCGMILADLGADVVKVETPGGDPSRREGPWVGERSGYYAQMNRNKRGTTIDARSDEGREQLRELLADADVFIENFRPGVLEAMGLGLDVLAELNPGLITASVSGFGRTSPINDRAAFDCIVQVLSGLAWTTGGEDDREPLLIGTYLVDVGAGLVATIGVLAALAQRGVDGLGQHVDATMIDAALALLGVEVIGAAGSGEDPVRMRNLDRTSAPANAYEASDGWVYVHAGPDHFWRRAMEATGQPQALELEELATEALRLENRELGDGFLASWVAGHTAAEAIEILGGAGVPVARINTITEALDDPDLKLSERIVTVADGEGHEFPTALAPLRLSRSPLSIRRGVPDLSR
ncbi:MAG TPA: CoA transferase [Solirubrobacterales bacterium]|nr:CoA transferase [Solirubrobacterales bacterium]